MSSAPARLELADGGVQPERDAGQLRAEAVVQVAADPSPLLLAGRQHGQARAPEVGGQADPAHGQREGRGQLLEGGLVARSQGGRVGPAHQQPADHLVVVAQQELPPVAGVRPGRRVGSVGRRPLPPVRSGDVDGHGVEPHLPAQAGGQGREQVLLLVDGAHVAHDLAHEGEGLVAGAVDQVVDQAPHPLPARLDQQRDRAGGGHQEPRRPAPADQAAQAGDQAGVDGDDAGGEQHPLQEPVGRPLPTARRQPDDLDQGADDDQGDGGDEQDGRHDVGGGEVVADDGRGRRHDGEDRGDATRHQPGRERVVGDVATLAPADGEEDDPDDRDHVDGHAGEALRHPDGVAPCRR